MKDRLSHSGILEKIKDIFIILVIAIPLYMLLGHFGITCPIRYFTGVSCAGCGMTRAWISVIHGNLHDAMYYHPLFWLVPLGILWYALSDIIPPRLYRIVGCIMIAAFLAVYLIRLILPDEIVVFKPADGLVLRILNKFIF